MMFSKFGKGLLAAACSALLTLGLTSCGPSNMIDFLYVTSNKDNPGQINVYLVDSESGALYQIPDSPYPAGRNPVYDVASPNGLYLYVANHDDNTIEKFDIGIDAKLYPIQLTQTPGTEPVAMAINSTGTALYVVDYYAPALQGYPTYTDLNPGPGALIVYPLDAHGNLLAPLTNGSTNFWPLECFPSNVALSADNNHVYVTNTNAVVITTSPTVTGTVPVLPPGCLARGSVSGFSVQASSSGAVSGLSAVAGSPFTTGGGSQPTGIATDPDNASLYVTDSALNRLDTFSIQSDGSLSLAGSTGTGTMPMGATVVSNPALGSSPAYKFLYVSNYTDGSISIYSFSSGLPSLLSTNSSGSSGPLCLLVEPDVERFLYVTNYTGGTVGGSEINPANGALLQNMNSPYPSAGQPTCVAAVAHPQGNNNGIPLAPGSKNGQ